MVSSYLDNLESVWRQFYCFIVDCISDNLLIYHDLTKQRVGVEWAGEKRVQSYYFVFVDSLKSDSWGKFTPMHGLQNPIIGRGARPQKCSELSPRSQFGLESGREGKL